MLLAVHCLNITRAKPILRHQVTTEEMLRAIALDHAVGDNTIDADVVAVFDRNRDGAVDVSEFSRGLGDLVRLLSSKGRGRRAPPPRSCRPMCTLHWGHTASQCAQCAHGGAIAQRRGVPVNAQQKQQPVGGSAPPSPPAPFPPPPPPNTHGHSGWLRMRLA
jgi:hypothetical protein